MSQTDPRLARLQQAMDLHVTPPESGGVDVVSGSPRDLLKKITADDALNLQTLQAAVAGLQDGSITPELYEARVKPIHQMAHVGTLLFSAPPMKEQMARMEPHEKALYEETGRIMGALGKGTARMMKYLKTGLLSDAEDGLRAATEAFSMFDRLQDEILPHINETDMERVAEAERRVRPATDPGEEALEAEADTDEDTASEASEDAEAETDEDAATETHDTETEAEPSPSE